MKEVLWVGLGGFLGANARYLLGGWIAARFGPTFPYGTFVINVTGSFLIGLIIGTVEGHVLSPTVRLAGRHRLRRRVHDLLDVDVRDGPAGRERQPACWPRRTCSAVCGRHRRGDRRTSGRTGAVRQRR